MTSPTDPQVPSAERREEVRALLKSHDLWLNDHRAGQMVMGSMSTFWSFLAALDVQSAERTRAEKVGWVDEQNRLLKALGVMGSALDAARAEAVREGVLKERAIYECAELRAQLSNVRAEVEAVRSELLALMDERIEHVKENVAALAKYQDSMGPGYSEPRCRELAALYLSEIRMMFAGWPEKPIPPSSIDTRLRAEVEKMREAAATHLHIKSGHEVSVVSHGRMQTAKAIGDMTEVTIYRHDGNWWVRPTAEFNDGRFRFLPIKGTSR